MSSAETQPGNGQAPDLSLLRYMVGVRKALTELVDRGQPLDKDAVLGILEAEQQTYARQGTFRQKEMALGEIVAALQQGSVGLEAVLEATGISREPKRAKANGFSLRGLFGGNRGR